MMWFWSGGRSSFLPSAERGLPFHHARSVRQTRPVRRRRRGLCHLAPAAATSGSSGNSDHRAFQCRRRYWIALNDKMGQRGGATVQHRPYRPTGGAAASSSGLYAGFYLRVCNLRIFRRRRRAIPPPFFFSGIRADSGGIAAKIRRGIRSCPPGCGSAAPGAKRPVQASGSWGGWCAPSNAM